MIEDKENALIGSRPSKLFDKDRKPLVPALNNFMRSNSSSK